jgi:tetratricopeptide (TPR) repeat protein
LTKPFRLNSSADTSEIDDALYMSYINLIFETADRPDATRVDVEKAESYYREALAIFPADRERVEERQELERVAKSLLSNKFYLYALELLDVDDYSVNSLQEALRLLNKAKNYGASSPAIESEINRTTLYLDAFDDFVNKRWEDAIDNLEQLYRTDPDYANGVIKFLLYEAYTARGDTLFTFGDYVNANQDYDEAAKFAYGESGTAIQLYQIEIRLGYTLRRLTSIQEASAYFDHAFGIVNFADKAADNASLLDTFNQARAAYTSGDYWNAVRLFEIALEDADVIYEFETVSANTGDSIAHLAFYYGSTTEAIRDFNELGDSMVVRTDTELVVPVLAEDRN